MRGLSSSRLSLPSLEAMRELLTLDVGGDANRSHLLMDPADATAWCVDPSYGAAHLLTTCAARGLRITEVFLTHTHGDHIATLSELLKATGARAWVHPLELSRAPGATALPGEGPLAALPGVEILFTPGHTPGGTCYIVGENLFTGDVLFVDWVGRSDFAGGNPQDLFRSLARLRALPPQLMIRPGHHYGSVESRSLGEEIQENKFLSCTDYGRFLSMQPELSE